MLTSLPPGVLPGQLSLGGDFDQVVVDAQAMETDSVFESEPSLATKEEVGPHCQVCDFPVIAGRVEGEIDGERYSLLICSSCLQHAVLCLRDSYRQCRLFDDDFEIEELCRFGKAMPVLDGEPKDSEQVKPVGRKFGADSDE